MDVSLGRLRELVVDGGLACCGSWGCKESDTTEQLNWTELADDGEVTIKRANVADTELELWFIIGKMIEVLVLFKILAWN